MGDGPSGGGSSPLIDIARDLESFLSSQFTPPAGSTAQLGFFAGGVAVEPGAFYVGNPPQPNPLLVDKWLNDVADQVAPVANGVCDYSFLTATELMQAIVTFATPTADIGSDGANAIGRLKGQAANAPDLGVISAAPLDWYDPSQIPSWPHYSKSTAVSTGGPSAGPTAPAEPDPRYWAWRRLPDLETIQGSHVPRAAMALMQSPLPHPAPPIEASDVQVQPVEHPVIVAEDFSRRQPLRAAIMPAAALQIESSAARPDLLNTSAVMTSSAAVSTDIASLPIEEQIAPIAFPAAEQGTNVSELEISSANLLVLASQQAQTTSVQASALSISLNYQFVKLSRAPWWSDLLINDARDWYMTQQHAGQLVPSDNHKGQIIGVPVALILTANVVVSGIWSEQDVQAVNSHTNLGPWSLKGATVSEVDSTGQASLVIPGMAACACILQILPILPPADDPSLAPVASPTPSETPGAATGGP